MVLHLHLGFESASTSQREREREMKQDTYYPNHVLSHMLISIVLLD